LADFDAMSLGKGPYSELWSFADLRYGQEFVSARYNADGSYESVCVSGLLIAHQRQKDGSLGWFLLVEVDEDAEVVDDWVGEDSLEETQRMGATIAEVDELFWEPIPDVADVRRYVRGLLRRPVESQ
jgi:hypothetical protein